MSARLQHGVEHLHEMEVGLRDCIRVLCCSFEMNWRSSLLSLSLSLSRSACSSDDDASMLARCGCYLSYVGSSGSSGISGI